MVLRTRRSRLDPRLLLLVLGIQAGCKSRESDPASPPSLLVDVATVTAYDVPQVVKLVGTLEAPPGHSARLGTLVPGRLAEVRVAEGDWVHKGDVLARLDPTPLRDATAQALAAVQQAQAQETNAQAHLQRASELFAAGAGPGKDVEDAQAALATAVAARRTSEASLSLAKNQTARSEIIAPLDGIVAHVFAAVGESMDGSGKPIVEVDEPEVLELQGGLSPALAALVSPGNSARVRTASTPEPLEGRVKAVSPAVDPATGLVRVRAEVNNRDGALRVGVAGEAEITVATHAAVPTVPPNAILAGDTNSGGRSVNVVGEDGHVHRKPVETGFVTDSLVEVSSGLQIGERVVLGQTYALPEGTLVQVRSVPGARDGGTL